MIIANNKKQTLIIIGTVAALLGFVSKIFYRSWVINNQIDDYGIQGFAPSFFYVIGVCLLMAGSSNKNYIKNMVLAAAGATAYELEQYYTSMVFDYMDLLATGVGLCLAILTGKTVLKNNTEEVEDSISDKF